jgi:predicted dienelactone hydrolase
MSSLVDPHLLVRGSGRTYEHPAQFGVKIERYVWHDASRDRDVPVTLYIPDRRSPVADRSPVTVFSHGIGEDRDSYAYLGRALAERGYLAVHVTHAGTDKATLQRGYRVLYRATKEKQNWINRPRDVSFVLDQLRMRPDADMNRVAALGHSAGAFTVLALAGMRLTDGSLADKRVKVGVAISMPKMPGVVPPGGYDSLAIPVLHMTGTCDTSLLYRTYPRDRRVPFEETHAPHQYLVTLQGVRHETFSNAEDRRHAEIAHIVTAFLDAWLLGNAQARAWLDEGGVPLERK